jgi:hypothetical protein
LSSLRTATLPARRSKSRFILYRLSIGTAQLRGLKLARRPGAFWRTVEPCPSHQTTQWPKRPAHLSHANRLLTFFCFDRYISEGDDAGAISEEDDDDDAEEEVEVEEEDEAETAPRE